MQGTEQWAEEAYVDDLCTLGLRSEAPNQKADLGEVVERHCERQQAKQVINVSNA